MSNDTFIAQEIASNPKQSVWVSASAGSGKTTVLIKRLLRLFLDGVDIGNILCLTYTEVGAVEMKNRLRDEAKKLTILSDDDLKEKLKDLLSTDNVESVSFKKNLAKARATINSKNMKLMGDCQVAFSLDEIWGYPKAFEKNANICSSEWNIRALNYQDILVEGSEARNLLKFCRAFLVHAKNTKSDAKNLSSDLVFFILSDHFLSIFSSRATLF